MLIHSNDKRIDEKLLVFILLGADNELTCLKIKKKRNRE